MTRIWWCQEHHCSADSTDSKIGMWCYVGPPSKCRMVPMRLIPDNAVNRFEVIDHTPTAAGRILSKWEDFNFRIDFDFQDGGRTLKAFLVETP